MTEEILKELWKIEDLAACKDGMALAHDFLKSCLLALESGNASNFNARFENFKRHRDTCEKCSGLGAVANPVNISVGAWSRGRGSSFVNLTDGQYAKLKK